MYQGTSEDPAFVVEDLNEAESERLMRLFNGREHVFRGKGRVWR
jgi:hypothetical protein